MDLDHTPQATHAPASHPLAENRAGFVERLEQGIGVRIGRTMERETQADHRGERRPRAVPVRAAGIEAETVDA